MTKEEQIAKLKSVIKENSELWDVLYNKEREIKKKREAAWERKYGAQQRLKKLLGIEDCL